MNKEQDIKYMNIAIEEAKKGRYRTHPNPLVGAVLVKNNKIISKGYHKEFRDKHAEQDAIDKAKESIEGSTLYVTLEPCHHHGNTPPCVDTIIKNKISRVVIASTDPNPLVNEKSINKLRNNKITVTTNICEEEARELNKSFFYKYEFNKPYIRLKLAVSIDGKIANQKKESKWITSSQSRMFVQKLRAEVNAILTTSSTVLHDNPKMNIRDEKLLKNLASQPALILLDRNLSVPPTSNIFKANRLVIIITNIDNSTNAPLRIYNDNVVIKYVKTTDSKIVLEDIYNIAKMYNLDDILVECGSSFSGTLLTEDAVDELLYFVAPKILGNQSISFSGIAPINNLKNKKTYKIKNIKSYKNDLYLDMRRN
jgi:diaminohydroxyphosphoribosylaminopyrimidine deaminase/5-amino-6-(5-phosphoribosylamino)uracil reductase